VSQRLRAAEKDVVGVRGAEEPDEVREHGERAEVWVSAGVGVAGAVSKLVIEEEFNRGGEGGERFGKGQYRRVRGTADSGFDCKF